MPKQKIVWTAVPYGVVDESRLRVSIVVSPRLTPENEKEERLEAFAEFLDWPAALRKRVLSLQIDGKTYALRLLTTPDSTAWKRVFPASTWVDEFRFKDMSAVNLRSFPVRNIVRFVQDHYGRLAQDHGTQRPNLFPHFGGALHDLHAQLGMPATPATDRTLRGQKKYDRKKNARGLGRLLSGGDADAAVSAQHFGDDASPNENVIGIDGKPTKNADRSLLRALPAGFDGLRQPLKSLFGTPAQYDFYQANRFYSRPENQREHRRFADADKARALPVIEAPRFDFHRMIAALADAPALARDLGLILDMEVLDSEALARAAAQSASPIDGEIRVVLGSAARPSSARPAVEGPAVAAPIAIKIDPENPRPRSAYRLSRRRFLPRSRTDDHVDGFLRLDLAGIGSVSDKTPVAQAFSEHPFDVVQLDADGAALKLINTVLTQQEHLRNTPATQDGSELQKDGGVTYTTTGPESLPALRTGGLAVTRFGRAQAAARQMQAAALKHKALQSGDGAGIVLFAEDLMRGYRVDVRSNDAWRSLCRRIADYRMADDGTPLRDAVRDEGYVKGASTTSKPTEEGEPEADHYLHETIFRWTGWSLAAPRPGRRIVPHTEQGLIQEERVEDVDPLEDVADEGLRVRTLHRAEPGSLPKLRFAGRYRLRARLVDLAGNSLSADDASIDTLEHASQEVIYQRYEPVDPPAVVLRTRVSEGESQERMVIRSDGGDSAEQYLKQAPYAGNDPVQSGFEYGAINHRHFVPPKTWQAMAEQHGMFDAAFGGTPAEIRQHYELIAAREAATLYHGPSAEIVTKPGTPVDDVAALAPKVGEEGFRLRPGDYLIHRDARVATPYLPDPLAKGASFRGLPGLRYVKERLPLDGLHPERTRVYVDVIPGTEEPYLFVSFAGRWPDVDGFRLQIQERRQQLDATACEERFADDEDPNDALPDGGLPVWDEKARTLHVFLRKGEIAYARYSSGLDARYLDHLGLPGWVPNPNAAARVRAQAMAGAHWMLTPDRPLTLVHATQRPICPPTFEQLHVAHAQDQTFADLIRTRVRLHARTTAKLEVLAEWMEWDDVPGSARPLRRRVRAQLADVQVPQPGLSQAEPLRVLYDQLAPPNPDPALLHYRHEFGDHKFRLVRYRLRGTTRFREYLPRSLTAVDDELQTLGPEWLRDSMQLSPLYHAEDPDALSPDHQERGAPLLPAPSSGTPAGQIVPASRRPASPKVAYVLPTFRWSPRQAGTQMSCTRLGNGLRVWLDRPWYSSGEGELLGVVLGSAEPVSPASNPARRELERCVTQWGLDPLHDSDLPRASIAPSAFTAKIAVDTVQLAELAQNVVVAGHRVHWDDARKQWFADLEINAGTSYMPFIRLALVRYQPNACAGCEISPVVMTDFMQLMPNRHVEVRRDGQTFHFDLYGPVPDTGTASMRAEYGWHNDTIDHHLGFGRGRNRFEVVVQTQPADIDTDLDWSDAPPASPPVAGGPGATLEPRRPVLIDQTELLQAQRTLLGVPLAPDRRDTPDRRVSAIESRDRRTMAVPVSNASAARPVLARDRSALTLAESATAPWVLVPERIPSPLRFDYIGTQSVAVPAFAPGTRARLLLREYERHFADDEETLNLIVTQLRKPKQVQRLVFAREFYLLDYQPEP